MNYFEPMDSVELKFTKTGVVATTTTIPVTDFRSAVIEALQAEIEALRADLKLTQQKLRVQENVVAAYSLLHVEKPKPTMGEKLANALKHDSFWT